MIGQGYILVQRKTSKDSGRALTTLLTDGDSQAPALPMRSSDPISAPALSRVMGQGFSLDNHFFQLGRPLLNFDQLPLMLFPREQLGTSG